MSRSPDLKLLSPAEALAAARRILAHPACNTQRVSLDEVYTLAVALEQFAEVAALAAAHLLGAATPADLASLRTHLLALGILPPAFSIPVQEPIRHDD